MATAVELLGDVTAHILSLMISLLFPDVTRVHYSTISCLLWMEQEHLGPAACGERTRERRRQMANGEKKDAHVYRISGSREESLAG